MATISPTVSYDNGAGHSHRCGLVAAWDQINGDDTGGPARIPAAFPDKTAWAVGTWDGSTLTLEVSPDGVNYETAQDMNGDPITLTANGHALVASLGTHYQWTSDMAGTTEDINAFIICAG